MSPHRTPLCIDYFLCFCCQLAPARFRFFFSLLFYGCPQLTKTLCTYVCVIRSNSVQAAQHALSAQGGNISSLNGNTPASILLDDARRRQHQQDQLATGIAECDNQQQRSYDCDSTSSAMATMANALTTSGSNSDMFLLGAALQQQNGLQQQLLQQQSSYLQQQQVNMESCFCFGVVERR